MSVKVMGAVWELKDLTANERLVLLALADHANHDGSDAHPGNDLIEQKTGLSRRTIQYALGAFQRRGLIKLTAGGRGRGMLASYDLSPILQSVKGATAAPLEIGEKVQPSRPSKEEKVQAAPLSQTEKVQTTTGKGANGDTKRCKSSIAYKEEPSLTVLNRPTKAGQAPRWPEPWLSIFQDAYELTHGCPYKPTSRDGDFTQLSILVKTKAKGSDEQWITPEKFAQGVQNYFSSDISEHSIADLANRFGVFYRSPIDRFKVPIVRPESVNGAPTKREGDNERKRRETRESIAAGFAASGDHRTADRILAGESWPFADGGDRAEADGRLLGEGADRHTNR